jgi:hypothetical protein
VVGKHRWRVLREREKLAQASAVGNFEEEIRSAPEESWMGAAPLPPYTIRDHSSLDLPSSSALTRDQYAKALIVRYVTAPDRPLQLSRLTPGLGALAAMLAGEEPFSFFGRARPRPPAAPRPAVRFPREEAL